MKPLESQDFYNMNKEPTFKNDTNNHLFKFHLISFYLPTLFHFHIINEIFHKMTNCPV